MSIGQKAKLTEISLNQLINNKKKNTSLYSKEQCLERVCVKAHVVASFFGAQYRHEFQMKPEYVSFRDSRLGKVHFQG